MLRDNVIRKRTPYTEFKNYLRENNIPQKSIAKMLKLKVSSINQKINGTGGDFTVEEVKIICFELGISAQIYFFPELVSNTETTEELLGAAGRGVA